jgi:hypothetical protein
MSWNLLTRAQAMLWPAKFGGRAKIELRRENNPASYLEAQELSHVYNEPE